MHLNYSNPWLEPFSEFQRAKTHPVIAAMLKGGKRIGYGARAITEGGHQSVPKLSFPGGALIGCAAGFVNLPRIKGSHNAMKTGMLAAEAAGAALKAGRANDVLGEYEAAYAKSWVAKDLRLVRNAKPLWSKLGTPAGIALHRAGSVDEHPVRPVPVRNPRTRKTRLRHPEKSRRQPQNRLSAADGVLTFDRLSSVFLSNTNHEERQPVHLVLRDPAIPISVNLPEYGEPAQRYCPAGVYEVVEEAFGPALPDQCPELRALQNLRHQGSVAEHQLGHPRRRRRPQLYEPVICDAH